MQHFFSTDKIFNRIRERTIALSSDGRFPSGEVIPLPPSLYARSLMPLPYKVEILKVEILNTPLTRT